IRDDLVTGVQTCALPICSRWGGLSFVDDRAHAGWQVQSNVICFKSMKSLPVLDPKAAAIDVGSEKLHVSIAGDVPKVFGTFTGRSEERRVGRERVLRGQ